MAIGGATADARRNVPNAGVYVLDTQDTSRSGSWWGAGAEGL